MFCHAYLAVLPHASELDVPRSKQMATVWPISSDEAFDQLNRLRNQIKDACQTAVDDYGLVIAQQALKDAELTGKDLSGAGPFLLAWSPATDKGKQDALVLVSNLSDITTYEQAQERDRAVPMGRQTNRAGDGPMTSVPPKFFISYSHADKKWLERLKRHLKPLVREGSLDFWDDTHIRPGDDWQQEIRTALDTAQAAVLLISADFFTSDFIDQAELPPLLTAARKRVSAFCR